MFKPAKITQLAQIARQSGKILPTAAILLSLVSPRLLAETVKSELESKIWTSNLNDYPSLERAAVRALQENPTGAYEHYLVAELSLRMFKHHPEDLRYLKQASDMSQQAIELAPNKEYGYLVAAQVLDLMGYKNDAAEMLADRPSFRQGWRTSFVRGVIAATYEGDKSSFSEFDKSLKAPDVAKDIVGSYIAMNLESNYAGTELVQKLELWHKRAEIPAMKISLAKALEEAGEASRAQAILSDLNKKQPTEETRLAEAALLYNQLKRTKDAESILLTLATNGKDSDMRMAAKSHLAKIRLLKGDVKTASSLFAESIEGTSEKLKWISFSHNAYRENQKLPAFSGLLTDLSERLPGSSYLYALHGEVQSEGLAQHEKAVASYEAAITLDPKRSEFYTGMGLAYYRMQKHEKALAIFNKAISIDPKDATARYNEACVLALMGRGDEAVGSLEKAILLDGRLQTVAQTDKDFETIRTNAQFQSLVQSPNSNAKNPNAVLTKDQ